jgi:hypothetical protein
LGHAQRLDEIYKSERSIEKFAESMKMIEMANKHKAEARMNAKKSNGA